jgi:hypothetical protein
MLDYLESSYVHSEAKHAEHFLSEINGLDFAPLTPPKNRTVLIDRVDQERKI